MITRVGFLRSVRFAHQEWDSITPERAKCTLAIADGVVVIESSGKPAPRVWVPFANVASIEWA